MSILSKIDEAVGFLDKYELKAAEKEAKKMYGNDSAFIKAFIEGYKRGYKLGYEEAE